MATDFWHQLYDLVGELREKFKQVYASEHGYMVTEDGSMADLSGATGEAAAQKRAELDAFFLELIAFENKVMQFSYLDPAPYQEPLDDLGAFDPGGQPARAGTAFSWLNKTVSYDDYMTKVMDLIDHDEWTGGAARQFEEGFLHDFGTAIQLQRDALYAIALLIKSYQEATVLAQKDLLNLISNGIRALSSSEIKLDSWGVVSLLGTVVALVAFPELTIAFAVGAAADGAGFISMFTSAEPPPEQSGRYQIAGGDTATVLRELNRNVQDLEDLQEENDRDIARGLREALNSPNAFAHPLIELHLPNMDLGTIASEDDIVVSIVDLYEAGKRHVPRTAACYSIVASHLYRIEVPKLDYKRLWPHSQTAATDVIDRLVEVFRNSSSVLEQVGDAMVQIAQNYALTDEQAAEVMRQVDERMPDPPATTRPPKAVF